MVLIGDMNAQTANMSDFTASDDFLIETFELNEVNQAIDQKSNLIKC